MNIITVFIGKRTLYFFLKQIGLEEGNGDLSLLFMIKHHMTVKILLRFHTHEKIRLTMSNDIRIPPIQVALL